MNVSEKGIRFIKRWEGLELKAYRPLPGDKWTIGHGHTMTTYEGMEIDEGRADTLLRADLAWVEKCINQNVIVNLTQTQFDALSSFVFNIGCSNFRASTLLKELNAGRYPRVPDQMKRWVHSFSTSDQPIRGLVNRRAAEIAMWVLTDNNIASNARPSVPQGQSMTQLAKSSKTIQASAVSGTVSLGFIADHLKTAQELAQNFFSDPVIIAAIAVLIVSIFLILNRKRDSRLGRAY